MIGPSVTQLFRNLSLALQEHLEPGSEIVLSELDHESNVAAWLQLAKWRGLTVKWWTAHDKRNPYLDPKVLRGLMTDRTRLVACTHSSNILGTINDIKAIARVVHATPGAFLCVDAVAFAPHRQVDVKDLQVDFYAFSWYKVGGRLSRHRRRPPLRLGGVVLTVRQVYGPHISTLYAAASTHSSLSSLGHYFKPRAALEDMIGLAAANYELTASLPHVIEYLSKIPWSAVAAYEEKLTDILISYLNSRPDIKIWGEPVADAAKRVPVISFTVDGRSSQDVVESVEQRSDFAIRWGSFYSNRLVAGVMGLDEKDGVVRVSLLHYNTEEEVNALVGVLEAVLERK